jgi:hypothetical protein
MKRRDWTAAREKCEAEGERCRVCKKHGVDAAHVVPRSINGSDENMTAEAVLPLCRFHHSEYDFHRLDLAPYLTAEEAAHAVLMTGSLEGARRIVSGRQR